MLKSGIESVTAETLQKLVPVFAERSKTLPDFITQSHFLFVDELSYDEKAVAKFLKPEIKPVLQEFTDKLEDLSVWDKEVIHQVIVDVAAQFELKMGKLAQPVRVCVTGSTVSPSLDLTLKLLGKEKALQRLNSVLQSKF